MKACGRCGVEKSFADFYKLKSAKDGYRGTCKQCCVILQKKRRKKDPLRYRSREKLWRTKNKEKYNKYQKLYRRKRMAEDANFRLMAILRVRLNDVLGKNQKVGSFVRDLGCSVEELKQHLESQFQPGMTWENHGVHGWHIDHIKSLASFDLTDREQFSEVCNYNNLQPLWCKENWSKGAK